MRCVQKNYGGSGREIKRIISLLPYYKELADALAKNNMYAEMNSGCYRRCGCEIVMDVDMIKAMKKHDALVDSDWRWQDDDYLQKSEIKRCGYNS